MYSAALHTALNAPSRGMVRSLVGGGAPDVLPQSGAMSLSRNKILATPLEVILDKEMYGQQATTPVQIET